VRYVRVFVDDDATTRFEDCEIEFAPAVFAPPAPPLGVAEAQAAREVLFVHFEAGWSDDAHPAPQRQWMFIMTGRGQTTASGEVRAWQAGDVFFLEDTTSPGHGTTVFEDATMGVVRV
jgi:quercetin dioxygenase-like cupin family protein